MLSKYKNLVTKFKILNHNTFQMSLVLSSIMVPITIPTIILVSLVLFTVITIIYVIPLPNIVKKVFKNAVQRPLARLIYKTPLFWMIVMISAFSLLVAYNSFVTYSKINIFNLHICEDSLAATEKYYRNQRNLYLSLFTFFNSVLVLIFSKKYGKINKNSTQSNDQNKEVKHHNKKD